MPDFYAQIDDYILGRLSAEEKAAFEAALAGDAALREELEFRREVQAGLREVQAEDLRARIRGIAEGGAPPSPRTTRSPWPYWLAAASVALLLGFAWWLWPGGDPVTGKELFAAYYNPQIQFDNPRIPETPPTLTDTLKARYEARDFDFLLRRLGKVPDSAKTRDYQLLEAVVLIELGRDAAVDALLADIRSAPVPVYANEAEWLLALLHLREEQFGSARPILEKIAADTAKVHQREALEILDKMGNRGAE